MDKTFKGLYAEAKQQPTPAAAFVARVAELTHRTETTVRMWLAGVQQPDELAKSVIADHFGSDMETLFPRSERRNENENPDKNEKR